MPSLTSFKNLRMNNKTQIKYVSQQEFLWKTPIQIAERAQNTGCDLLYQMSEFSKTAHAQTPVWIATKVSVRVPYKYPPAGRIFSKSQEQSNYGLSRKIPKRIENQ